MSANFKGKNKETGFFVIKVRRGTIFEEKFYVYGPTEDEALLRLSKNETFRHDWGEEEHKALKKQPALLFFDDALARAMRDVIHSIRLFDPSTSIIGFNDYVETFDAK